MKTRQAIRWGLDLMAALRISVDSETYPFATVAPELRSAAVEVLYPADRKADDSLWLLDNDDPVLPKK